MCLCPARTGPCYQTFDSCKDLFPTGCKPRRPFPLFQHSRNPRPPADLLSQVWKISNGIFARCRQCFVCFVICPWVCLCLFVLISRLPRERLCVTAPSTWYPSADISPLSIYYAEMADCLDIRRASRKGIRGIQSQNFLLPQANKHHGDP